MLINVKSLNLTTKKTIAFAAQDQKRIEKLVGERMQAVVKIQDVLIAQQVPVIKPAGGHAVMIDVSQIKGYDNLAYSLHGFLATLYAETGIRGGLHNTGLQKNSVLKGLNLYEMALCK